MTQGKPTNAQSTIIGNCLSCQGLVRVGVNTPATAEVRCPHCEKTFPLVSLLDQMAPELEVVTPQTPETIVPIVDQIVTKRPNVSVESEKFVVPPQLSKGARRRRGSSSRSGRRSSSSSRSSEPQQRRSSRRENDSESQRINTQSPARRNQAVGETSNPVFEILKIVAGAALAIPIAYLIVMWCFGQDPLNAGPQINSVTPFLVPQALKGEPDASNDTANSENASKDDQNEDNTSKADKEGAPGSSTDSPLIENNPNKPGGGISMPSFKKRSGN